MKRLLLLVLCIGVYTSISAQNCSDIFISEYVEGTYNNKAIELYNPTPNPIVLDGVYSMGRDRDGAGVPMLLPITGTIAPLGVRVFVLDKRDPNGTGNEIAVDTALQAVADTFVNPVYVQTNSPFYFNGDDAFVLVKNGNQILDLLGKIGEDPGGGWWQPGDTLTRWWTQDNTLIRKQEVLHGVSTNPDVFDPSLEWDSLPANTFTELGQHTCNCLGSVSTENISDLTFSVFPNPIASGRFVIRGNMQLDRFTLFTAEGCVMLSGNLSGMIFNDVALPEAAPGVYYLEVYSRSGERRVEKLLVR